MVSKKWGRERDILVIKVTFLQKILRIRIQSAKVKKKYVIRLKWVKFDSCMHLLIKIDGYTLCTNYYEDPAFTTPLTFVNYN